MSHNIGDYAAKGGTARGKNRPLTLSRVEDELPRLDSVEHCQQRLARLSDFMAAGLVSGASASALVRAHSVWLEAETARVDMDRLKVLEVELLELKAQLARAGVGHLRKAG